ncbi:MAG: MarR family transcriptional regulator [Cellvibrionaceae bacterium]
MIFDESSVGFLITDVSRLLRRAFQRRMAEGELTLAQSRALVYIARHPGIRQVELADLLEVQPITLARLVDQLELLELVERRADPRDRRAYQLFILEKANNYLEHIQKVICEMRDEAFKGMTEEEKKIMCSALEKTRNNLSVKGRKYDR